MRRFIAVGCALSVLLAPVAARAEAWKTVAPGPGQAIAGQIDETGAFLLVLNCSAQSGQYVFSVSTAPDGLPHPGGPVSVIIDFGEQSFEFPVKYANKDGRSGVVLSWDMIDGDDFYFDFLAVLEGATAPIKLDIADTHLSFDHTGVAEALGALDKGCI